MLYRWTNAERGHRKQTAGISGRSSIPLVAGVVGGGDRGTAAVGTATTVGTHARRRRPTP